MKNFIFQFITFVLSALLTCVIGYYGVFNPVEGLATLSLIVIIPLCMVFYVILITTLIPCIINGFKAVFSGNLGIKITAVIILVLTVLLILFNVYCGLNLFGVKLF